MSSLSGYDRPNYYLGIDGGGTKTDFALADEKGTLLRRITLDASNPNDVGFPQTEKILQNGITMACEGIDLTSVSVFAGLAGCSSAENAPRIYNFLKQFPFSNIQNDNDAKNAIAASLGKRDGVTVVMGTGSIVYAKNKDALYRIGGYGYLFGDEGSGFSLGKDAILAALRQEDGSGAPTLLHDYVKDQCAGDTVLSKIDVFYRDGKKEIAKYAPLVFKAFQNGDAVACKILTQNIATIAEMISAAADKLERASGTVTVVLCGGLCAQKEILIPLLHSALKNDNRTYQIEICTDPPVIGALRMAGMPY